MQQADNVRALTFVERAPHLRSVREWHVLTIGFWLALGIVVEMLGQFVPSTPEIFGTAWGDGALSATEVYFLLILAGFAALTLVILFKLIPPFHIPVELRIDPANNLVSVLRGGRCAETVKLSDVRGFEIGPYPFPDGPIADWVKPTGIWAVDLLVRRKSLTRSLYLQVGGDEPDSIEVAAFVAPGDEGEKLAQRLKNDIERAMLEVQSAQNQ